MAVNAAKELERLYQLDYGDRVELSVRFIAIFVSGILHIIYTSEMTAVLWLGGFFVSHGLCILQLRAEMRAPSRYAIEIAAVLNALILAAFLWFPLTLIFTHDMLLHVAGIAAVVSAFFFVLRRSDTLIEVVTLQSVLGAACIAYIAFSTIPLVDGLFAKACVLFVLSLVAVYFAIGLMKSRSLRLELLATSEQTAQEQKLSSIGKLAGGVAHDFNNALTGISGNLELYFELDNPRERDELVRIAQEAAHRAAELVNQLLVFSRKSEITRQRLALAELIEEAVAFKRRLLPANITLHSASQPGIVVDVDKTLFVTALINLSVNAVDAMPEGGTLSITAKRLLSFEPIVCIDTRTLPVGRYAVVTVADTGTGIPPEILPRIVEPFFSTKPAGQGSGLGLSMVVGLAQSLDGGVQIVSGPEGTTVSIYVPDQAPARRESAPDAVAAE